MMTYYLQKLRQTFTAILVTSLFATPTLLAAEYAKNILYINSYHRGYSWSDNIEDSLRKGLTEYSDNIELSVEYLDSRRFPGLNNISRISQSMTQKYADYPIDLLVTSDNAALDFVIKYRDDIFPNTPVVFSGYNNFKPAVVENFSNVTGVNEEVELLGTIKLATSIHPEARNLVFIVSTRDPSANRIYKYSIKNIFPKFENKYNIILLKNLSIKNITYKLNRLPENSILFMSGKAKGMTGNKTLTPEAESHLIAAASPFPTYGLWLFSMDTGVLGGKVLTGSDQGKEATKMAIKILNGASADDIPVLLNAPTTTLFDYKVMDRFNIPSERLPADSTIINQPVSIWKEYRLEILLIVGALFIEAIFILALAINMRRHNKTLLDLSEERNHLKDNVKNQTEELNHANKKLSELSLTDDLTQLANRRNFEHTLAHEMMRARRSVKPLSLLKLNIDHFKQYDNQYGHDIRENCLISIGKILHEVIDRSTDLAARCQVEEFAIILPETDSQGANKIARDIHQQLSQISLPVKNSTLSECPSINIGLMTFNNVEQFSTSEDLIELVDKQLSKAQQQGTNQISSNDDIK